MSTPEFQIPLGDWLVSFVFFLKENLQGLFDAIRIAIDSLTTSVLDALNFVSPLILIIIVSLISWRVSGWKASLFSLLGLVLIWSMNIWAETMQTLSLILVATVIAIMFGIPLGIYKGSSKKASIVMEPILDFMQTLNPLVYLIPAVLFFQIGDVPGVLATVVFAMPPSIRLTALGLEQVSKDMIEVGEAFGANKNQMLKMIKVPLAFPSIMMGINQTIMLAFSMVVIAGFIGASGLGQSIISGIQRYSLAPAIEAGIAVVILAIILDRMTRINSVPKGQSSRNLNLVNWAKKLDEKISEKSKLAYKKIKRR